MSLHAAVHWIPIRFANDVVTGVRHDPDKVEQNFGPSARYVAELSRFKLADQPSLRAIMDERRRSASDYPDEELIITTGANVGLEFVVDDAQHRFQVMGSEPQPRLGVVVARPRIPDQWKA